MAASDRTEFVLVAIPLPVMFIMLLSPGWVQRRLCPKDTLVAGHLLGLGLVLGAIACAIGLLLAGVGRAGSNNLHLSDAKRQNAARLAVLGVPIAILSLGVWMDGLFSYYCATPKEIVVHPDPFLKSISHPWSDVRHLSAGCFFSRAGMSIDFSLTLQDGAKVGLGGDSWSMLKESYEPVRAALRLANYSYDNKHTVRCPRQLRQFFSEKPT